MEELASHGYIIFSIGHAYEALLALDSQGQVVPTIPPATSSQTDFQKMQALINQMKSAASRLDLEHIGVFGMSFGGATAFEVCAIDMRCQAALNIDGFQYGTLLDDRVQTPFMMMYSEVNDHINDWVLNDSPESGYSLRVKDTTHLNYTDFNLLAPILLGKIDSARIERIMSAYTLAFFNQTLKGVPSLLLQAANPDYPEVELRIFSATPH